GLRSAVHRYRRAHRKAPSLRRAACGALTQNWQKSAHHGWASATSPRHPMRPWLRMSPGSGALLRVELPAGVEVIEVEQCVEDERIGANRLTPVDRIVREQHHVSFLHRHVDHDWPLRNIAPAVEQAGNQKVALIRESQRNARTLAWRDDRQRGAQLLVSDRRGLPWLDRHARRRHVARRELRPALRHVGIVNSAAAGCAHCLATTKAAASTPAACVAYTEAFTVFAVHREAVRHAVHERARIVDNTRTQQTSHDLAAARLIRADPAREPVLDREIRGTRYSDEHSAACHE